MRLGRWLHLTMRLSVVINKEQLDRIFIAVANDHRRAIIQAVAVQPRSISELADIRGLSLPAIHRHVRALEDAGVVRRRKVGRTNFLALDRAPLRALQTWTNQFSPYWGTEAETFENYAEHLGRTNPTKEPS